MKKRIISSLFLLLLLLTPFVFAGEESHIIKTNVDIRFFNGTLKVTTEGDDYEVTLSGNVTNVDLTKNIEVLFVRDIICEEYEMVNITRSMINLSNQMISVCKSQCAECLSEGEWREKTRMLSSDLSDCVEEKISVNSTITDLRTQVENEKKRADSEIQSYRDRPTQKELDDCEDDTKSKTTWLILLGIAVAGAGGYIYWDRRKDLAKELEERDFGESRNKVDPKWSYPTPDETQDTRKPEPKHFGKDYHGE